MARSLDEARSKRATVLVVEDEYLVRWETSEQLRGYGFEVLEAHDAVEALRILESVHIDAIFSDITINGDMDGIGLAEWVRKSKPQVKVVLTSGKDYSPSEVAGFGEVIGKPYYCDYVAKRLWAAVQEDEPTEL